VVNAAHNQRMIRVAVYEVDDDLMTYAGNEDTSVLRAGPALRYPDPGGIARLAIHRAPVKPHLDPAVLVRSFDDFGCLRARYDRLLVHTRRTVFGSVLHAGHGVAVDHVGFHTADVRRALHPGVLDG